MKLSVCKLMAACLAVFLATIPGSAFAQTVNPDDVLYLMPSWGAFNSASNSQVQQEIDDLRARLGPEGPYVKLGFTAFVGFQMTDWNIDITDPVAMRKAIASTVNVIDALINKARQADDGAGIPIAFNLLTLARETYDGAQTGSETEDVRSMQWYADNDVARGWWSTSRYNRKKMLIAEAYTRALGKVLANRMALYPHILVAASGDGEVELAFAKAGTTNTYADYSPFTIAEFRDWLRNGGLYTAGQPFAGQGYANAARYASDVTPGLDTNGDGHTLNGDFGTSFTSWNLLHFDWSLADAFTANAIPLATYQAIGFNKAPGTVAGGFDAPRVPKAVNAGDAWWNVWVLFKQTMLQRHNQEYARWITTSVDPDTNTTFSSKRWFSYQIPADYLFGGSPAAPNDRWHSSMSSLMTADISPYGGMGITAFNVDFTTPTPCYGGPGFIAPTLKNAAPQISNRNVRWAIVEWHPGQRPECPANNHAGGFSPLTSLYTDEMAIVEQYGPTYLAPFIWDAPTDKNRIKGTPFETALKAMVGRLRNGRVSDPRIGSDVADGATISLPFTFTGTAIDLGKVRGTSHGTGVDQVAITITPTSVGSPTTLDVTYGIARTDTASAHGSQFTNAGFRATIPKLPQGQYTITITARSTVGIATTTTKVIPVTVVYAVIPSPLGLNFGGTRPSDGAAANVFTAPQVITPTYGGNSTPTYTAVSNQPWIQVTPGPATGQFTVGIVNTGNAIGTSTSLSGAVAITGTFGGVIAGSVNVPITLKIVEVAASPLPFGAFDTPVTSTTPVSGSIPVSGWALDDVGIARVEIWRDLAAGETTPVYSGGGLGNGKIYVADVSFVEGARPDIAAQYPNNPNAHKAGWGYLMLTQGLYNQGNGTFTFYAFAYDLDGRSTSLGSKTVAISNATAVKPFGNIDQPANGQTLSTTDPVIAHWNFGWALTPNATPPCSVVNATGSQGDPLPTPLRGVYVAFDSGELRRVSYGDLRADIQSLFPDYTNTNGAGGAYFIDISTLNTGLHQLGWYVVDDCDRAEGIGSRFVNIVNSSGIVPVDTPMMMSLGPADSQPVEVVRSSGVTERIAANSEGVRVVSMPDNERIEVHLPSNDTSAYVGYQIANGERRALPLGSSLSFADGVFYWHPAPGFRGAFDLEFVGDTSRGRTTTRVRVVVGPSMRLTVDTPQPGAVVGASFAVGGWALDLAGENGGVDAIDVWAYRSSPNGVVDPKPTYLGQAIYGGSRGDVAAVHGSDFEEVAFDLVASGLTPGTYDLAVFARRTATGKFESTQVVRITVQ